MQLIQSCIYTFVDVGNCTVSNESLMLHVMPFYGPWFGNKCYSILYGYWYREHVYTVTLNLTLRYYFGKGHGSLEIVQTLGCHGTNITQIQVTCEQFWKWLCLHCDLDEITLGVGNDTPLGHRPVADPEGPLPGGRNQIGAKRRRGRMREGEKWMQMVHSEPIFCRVRVDFFPKNCV